MAIYKQDAVIVNGVTTGEVLSSDEIRMSYRMAGSINVGGVQYQFVGMDNGEAVYHRQDVPSVPTMVTAPHVRIGSNDGARTIDRADLPHGAILHPDFVGGRLRQGGQAYRMVQPVTTCEGMYVFVEAA